MTDVNRTIAEQAEEFDTIAPPELDQSQIGSARQGDGIQTPSQTVGPFFGYALPYEKGWELVPGHHPQAIRFHGTVYDGDGAVVPDAIIEIWQADSEGVLSTQLGSLEPDGYTFTGFGRTSVNLAGHFSFTTVKPGAVAAGAAPYILVTIFARGLTHHLFTRAYFPPASDAESAAHEGDRVLPAVPTERRATLISVADGPASYRFDIRMQGVGETVFLDFDD
ncbi:protocatechuate 3,4-dioxygenase subunit alpha [Glaciibacter superstes]|uniref:protocatechuate 3,4-dioxygenase subunit alpha n=1 Tax=Glaciibacter superstes TaxID=501023 RepID=UPI0003B56F98|nr:protocatechuate 3,4-dioxygenase subunit alpha [Glaciibacter superstes]